MKDITLKELIDIAVSEVPTPDDRIEKMFEWHFERELTITKWLLGAAASIFVAMLISYYKKEFDVELWQIILGILFVLFSFSYGIYRLYRLRNIHKQFVAALTLMKELLNIVPFIKTYRSLR